MAGTTAITRVAGLPSGYPAEIDSNVKIRFVDNMLVNMADRDAPLLKYFGGIAQFTFDNPKVEWVEDDVWLRRPTHTGLANAAATALTVTAQAHRYPIGTILCHVADGELVRVNAIADANTLTITRDIDSSVTEGAWAGADEVILAGQAMSEDENWAYRPGGIFSLPFNYAQVSHVGIQVTFRRNATALYGLRGTDLDDQSAKTVAEQFVALEGMLMFGKRFAGSAAANPALAGGIRYYVATGGGSSESGNATNIDLNGAALTRADIEGALQTVAYNVGMQNVPDTFLCSIYAARKISSFFTGAERINSPGQTTAGVYIDTINSAFGPIRFIPLVSLAKDDMIAVRRDNVKIGHYAGLGRPHLLQLPNPSATGPRIQRAYYGDTSVMVKGVQGAIRIQEISLTA